MLRALNDAPSVSYLHAALFLPRAFDEVTPVAEWRSLLDDKEDNSNGSHPNAPDCMTKTLSSIPSSRRSRDTF